MAKVIRIIWRFDFDVSYAFLDHRGQALRVLTETVPKFFNSIADGVTKDSFVGERRNPELAYSVSVEATGIGGTIEWAEGMPFKRIAADDTFRSTNKLMHALGNVVELKLVNRGGVRFLFLDGQKQAYSTALTEFAQQKMITHVEATLGRVVDSGIILEGNDADGLGYRAHYGPLDKKNILQATNLDLPLEQMSELLNNSWFCDLDIYETKFTLLENSLIKWARTKIDKATKFAEFFSQAR